jgi:hypothetical protein
MAGDQANLLLSTKSGFQQGVMALLGSKTSQALLALISPEEMLLFSFAALALAKGVPRLAVLRRVSAVMLQVFSTIALSAALSAVVMPEVGSTLVNIASVYALAMGLEHEAGADTAKYLLVSKLAGAVQGFQYAGIPVAWTLACAASLARAEEGMAEIARLVTVQCFTQWLSASMPQSMLFATVLLLMYLASPFVEVFPPMAQLYQFAVFAVTNDMHLQSVPLWALGAVLWVVWTLEPDAITKQFAAIAGANVLVLLVLQCIGFAVDSDPAPVLLGIIVTIGILENPASA